MLVRGITNLLKVEACMIDIKTGTVTLNDGCIVTPQTTLDEFVRKNNYDIKSDVCNIPFRSFILMEPTLNVELKFYFVKERLQEILFVKVPYEQSSFEKLNSLADDVFAENSKKSFFKWIVKPISLGKISHKKFSWGNMNLVRELNSDFFCLSIEYFMRPNIKPILQFPEIELLPKAKNKFPFGSQHTLFKDLEKKYKSDSVSFLEINHTGVWKHSFGGLPEWLKFEIGPYCPKCKEEMSFFAQLSFPANYGFDIDRHLYIFICTSCQLTTSLIK